MTNPTMPPPPPSGAPGMPASAANGNVFGILALIFGIASVVLCCIWGGIWAGIPAIVLGIIGVKKANEGVATNKPLSFTGLGLGAAGLVLTIIVMIVGFSINVLSN
jgi:hypothetical protein